MILLAILLQLGITHPGQLIVKVIASPQEESKSDCERKLNEDIKQLSRALEQRPDDDKAFELRGTAKYLLGRFDEAIKDHNEAIRLNPKDAGHFYQRGSVWQKKNELDKALSDYNVTLKLNPKHSLAYLERS